MKNCFHIGHLFINNQFFNDGCKTLFREDIIEEHGGINGGVLRVEYGS